jgi:diguanylate cyclase (GGDEF)-like protein
MKESGTKKILIIDDSIEHIKILISLLEDLYDIHFAKNGKHGLELLAATSPDLILLDILMPEMDGFEVCQEIKKTDKGKETPLIFISARGEDEDETRGLELGAIDYITKPFNPAIVRARIRNHLQLRAAMEELKHLYSLALDANPMTGLPGNNSIAKQIEDRLVTGQDSCVIYTDIDNFKAYNDKYGFARGDEVIHFTARTLKESVEKSTSPESFVGHVGGDDFILIVPSEHCYFITDEIVRHFDREIIQFYNSKDSDLRHIQTTNRRGEPQIYPIMSISIAGIDLNYRRYSTYLEVNDACAEMKHKAKSIPGSIVCFDQRKEESTRHDQLS